MFDINKKSLQLFSLVVGQFLVGLTNFLLIQLLIRVLTLDEFGQYNLYITVVAFIITFLTGPLSSATARYFIEDDRSSRTIARLSLLIRMRLYMYLVICIFFVLLTLKYSLIETTAFSFDLVFILLVVVLFGVLVGLNSCNSALHNAIQQRFLAVMLNLVLPVLRLISVWIISFYFSITLEMVFIILMFSAFITYMLHDFVALKNLPNYFLSFSKFKVLNYFWQRKIIIYALPIVGMGFSYWLVNSVDKYVAATYFALEDLANYAYALQLSVVPISLITAGITQFSWPIIFSNARNKINPQLFVLNKLKKISFVYVILAVILCYLINRYFFLLEFYIFPSKISLSATNFSILIASGFIISISQILSLYHEYLFDTKRLMYIRLVSALISIVVLIICVELFSVAGLFFSHLFGALIFVTINLVGIYWFKNRAKM